MVDAHETSFSLHTMPAKIPLPLQEWQGEG
jgi:hypothetical protein